MPKSSSSLLGLLAFCIIVLPALSGCQDKSPSSNVTSGSGDTEQTNDGVRDHPEIDGSESNTAESKTAETGAVPVSKPKLTAAPTDDPKPFEVACLSWNVESEGSDPKTIAKELIALVTDHDVVALCEVLPEAAPIFRDALNGKYTSVVSRSGFNDRLQILFNKERFEFVRKMELREINPGNYRSPLVVHLRERTTGREFMVMNNHLARGKAEVRQDQAAKLVEWARDEALQLPTVALGDYNFDFVFETERGNKGFELMLKDNIWLWVKPEKYVDTNWYDPEPDGVDNFPGSMLDFGFVCGAAKTWNPECKVIVRKGDFPDDETTSDHRPFELRLSDH